MPLPEAELSVAFVFGRGAFNLYFVLNSFDSPTQKTKSTENSASGDIFTKSISKVGSSHTCRISYVCQRKYVVSNVREMVFSLNFSNFYIMN